MSEVALPQYQIPAELFEVLSESCLRVIEELELDEVLQAVADGARNITGARYSLVELKDDRGHRTNLAVSSLGIPDAEWESGWLQTRADGGPAQEWEGSGAGEHDGEVSPPQNHPQSLEALVSHQGGLLGSIFVADKNDGEEFTPLDEHVLSVFATHSGAAVNNARKYQEQLRAKTELEMMTDLSFVGGLVIDAKTGELVSVTDKAPMVVADVLMPGRSMRQIMDVMTFQMANGRVVNISEHPLTELMKNGETLRSEEITISVPDGRSMAVIVNAQPIFSEDGEVISYVVAVQTTPSGEARARLRAEFAGSVSQGLNAPLTTIKGSTAFALGSPSPMNPLDTSQLFQVIEDQASHMRDYLNGLVDLTRLDAGMLDFHLEPVNLTDLINDAKAQYARGGGQAIIAVNLPDGLPQMQADRERIVEVLRSLFTGISSLTLGVDEIAVTALLGNESWVTVSVSNRNDTDSIISGITPISRISTMSSHINYVGANLGFALSQRIVEAHGGRFGVEDDTGEFPPGFAFTLPVMS